MNPFRWRLMTWVVWGWTGLIGLGVLALLVSIATNADCDPAEDACAAGVGLAAMFWLSAGFCVWFLGFVTLAIIWFMTKPERRYCPACGREMARGKTACKRCGFDASRSRPSSPAASPPAPV